MDRLITGSVLIIFLSVATLFPALNFTTSDVLAAEASPSDILPANEPIHTTSRFETKLISQVQTLPKNTTYQDDPTQELGDETTLSEGSDGKKTQIFKVEYFEGEEYSRDLVSTEVESPKDKVISRGTKIVWRTLDTPNGQISYWHKIHVWATHYDSHCPGCDEWTATGMRQGKGVIAVDPKIIKLGSKVFVPGYGLAIAGDTGGAIKGNIIDLGFEDARTAGWYAHFVDIYLL